MHPSRVRVQEGLGFLQKAADQGNQFAQYALGKLYYEGILLPKDMIKAEKFFRLSAAQDNDFAIYRLGTLLVSKVPPLPQYIKEGLTLLESAAAKKNSHALYMLGKLYTFGMNVKQDRKKGTLYLKRAEALGNQAAVILLKNQHAYMVKNLLCGIVGSLIDRSAEQRLFNKAAVSGKARRNITEKPPKRKWRNYIEFD